MSTAEHHPNYPALPLTHGVLLQGVVDVTGALDAAMARTDRYDTEEFEIGFLHAAIAAALPNLQTLGPVDLVSVIAEGLARNLLASMRWTRAHGLPVTAPRGRVQ